MDLSEGGLGLQQDQVPGVRAQPGDMQGEPGRRGRRPPSHVDDYVGCVGLAYPVLHEDARHLVQTRHDEPSLHAGQPVGVAAQPPLGHPAYGPDALRADLDRFTFLLGGNDGEFLLGEDPGLPPPPARPRPELTNKKHPPGRQVRSEPMNNRGQNPRTKPVVGQAQDPPGPSRASTPVAGPRCPASCLPRSPSHCVPARLLRVAQWRWAHR